MADNQHRPRKRFGQNFLHDQGVISRMLQSINPQAGDMLVEIGPGEGALTCPLLEQHGELTAIELDRDLAPQLQDKCAGIGRLILHQGDALKFDFSSLVTGDKKIRLVGNLPYNISTPILFHLEQYAPVIQDMHVLLQREVGTRITAEPGGSDYGKLSVMMQKTFQTALLFNVGPGAFRPPPKVQSTFIRLTPHPAPVVEIQDQKRFNEIVTAAFSQRRKTLRNALKTHLSTEQFEAAAIDPSRRAETLSLEEFSRLARQAKITEPE